MGSDPLALLMAPVCASTSPLVRMPWWPVALMALASVMPASASRRRTEGRSGFECCGWAWIAEGVGEGVAGEGVGASEGAVEVGPASGFESAGEGADDEVAAAASSCEGISMLDRSSPSSARTAMSLPTGTPAAPSFSCRAREPSQREEGGRTRVEGRRRRTRILPMMPSSCASTSIEALSVSMVRRTAPASNASPSLTFHSLMPPSVMVGDCVQAEGDSVRGGSPRGR